MNLANLLDTARLTTTGYWHAQPDGEGGGVGGEGGAPPASGGGAGGEGGAPGPLGGQPPAGGEGGKPPAGDGGAGGDKGAVIYEFKFADGAVVPDEAKTAAEAFAKQHNLPPEAAADLSKLMSDSSLAWPAKHQEELQTLFTGWANEAKADPEIGGEHFEANVALANKAVGMFGNEKFTKLLADTGLGLHPEMVRVFHKIGKLISEDSVAGAINGLEHAQKSAAQIMYPNQPSTGG